jgi:hypothetical protein
MSSKLIFFLAVAFALVSQVSCQKQSSEMTSDPPRPTGNQIEDIKKYGDIMREEIAQILGEQNLTAYTKDYGFTTIRTESLPVRSEVALAKMKPWSSWWYPKKEDLLFSSSSPQTSTLSKYDKLRNFIAKKNRKQSPPSAYEYEKKNFDSQSFPWEGLCDAWSLAAISHPEPTRGAAFLVDGEMLEFSVGDLKALLLKTYESASDQNLKYYGQKFSGNKKSWIYPDLFPEQFHRILEVELFQNQRPFIMDHDPGIQIWNVPVYKANYQMTAHPNRPNEVLVTAWVYSAEPLLSSLNRSEIGTKEAVREYNYVLTGFRNATGDLVINSGYWTKGASGTDSRSDHPDYIIQILDPTSIGRKSPNPEIDTALVDQLLEKARNQ